MVYYCTTPREVMGGWCNMKQWWFLRGWRHIREVIVKVFCQFILGLWREILFFEILKKVEKIEKAMET